MEPVCQNVLIYPNCVDKSLNVSHASVAPFLSLHVSAGGKGRMKSLRGRGGIRGGRRGRGGRGRGGGRGGGKMGGDNDDGDGYGDEMEVRFRAQSEASRVFALVEIQGTSFHPV